MANDYSKLVQFRTGSVLPTSPIANAIYFIKDANGKGSLYKGGTLIAETNDTAKIAAIEQSITDINTDLAKKATKDELAAHVALYEALVGVVGGHTTELQNIKNHADVDNFADVMTELAKYQLAGDYATKAQAQAYADAKDTAIAAAQKAGDDAAAAASVADGKAAQAQKEVDELETYVGTFTHETAKSVVEYVDAKTSGIASSGAMEALAGRVKAIEDDYLKEEDKTELSGAITAEQQRAEGIESGLRTDVDAIKGDYLKAADKEALQDGIDAVDDKVTVLVGEDTGKSVRTIANEELAAQLIPEGAQESLDTLQEIAQWIQDHPDDASAMNTAINALKDRLDGLGENKGDVKKYIDDAIAALNVGQYALAADLTALAGRVTTLEEAIAEGGSVAVAIAAAQKAGDDAGAAAQQAQSEVDALETVVAGKAAQSDLEAVSGRVATAEGKITALEGKVGDASVEDQISDALDAALKVEGEDKYALASALEAEVTRATGVEETLITALSWQEA